uniref:Uncharacterized protein n=1 Tax=Anguilla anguilla TaxID=7936 RepID=A0A0E9QCB5_ANGAN
MRLCTKCRFTLECVFMPLYGILWLVQSE